MSEKIRLIQQHLKSKGHDIGTSGPARDGVDGDLGNPEVSKTVAAIMQEFGISAAAPAPSGGLRASAKAFAVIKEFEGYARKLPNGDCQAYPDPGSGGDPWTIGFGSTGPGIARGVIWTRAQAEERLEADVIKFAAGVASLIHSATTQAQFDAMVSLAYNIGLGNFRSSTLLRKHNAGDYAGAAAQFGVWNKASGHVMDGLIRRRAAEAAIYRGA